MSDLICLESSAGEDVAADIIYCVLKVVSFRNTQQVISELVANQLREDSTPTIGWVEQN